MGVVVPEVGGDVASGRLSLVAVKGAPKAEAGVRYSKDRVALSF